MLVRRHWRLSKFSLTAECDAVHRGEDRRSSAVTSMRHTVNEPARIRVSIERRRVDLLPAIFVALAVAIFLRYPLGLLMLAVRLGFH